MKNCGKINFENKYIDNKKGISLVVLMFAIGVIIILASMIIINISTTNPIKEGYTAKYEYDIDNIQAVFTSTVSKVMTAKRSSISIKAVELNQVKSGVQETIGEVQYTVDYNIIGSKSENGKIIFDKKENKENEFYTGYKLPIYSVAETTWRVDEDGNITLKVGEEIYGKTNVSKVTVGKLINSFTVVRSESNIQVTIKCNESETIDEYIYYVRGDGEENWREFTSTENKLTIDGIDNNLDYQVKVKIKKGEYEEESLSKTVKHKTEDTEENIDETNGSTYTVEALEEN